MKKRDEEILRELGNPVLPEPSENFYRVRRNCLIGSSIILLVLYLIFTTSVGHGTLRVELPIISLSDVYLADIYIPLLFLQFYLLAHFAVLAIIYFMETRLRITGTFKPYRYVADSGIQDGRPHTPKEISRFSNLYNWWSYKAATTCKFEEQELIFQRIEAGILEFQEKNKNDPNILQCINSLQEIRKLAQAANRDARELLDIIKESSPTILPRLTRFDNWVKEYEKIQLFNLILIELLLPFFLGGLSSTLGS